MCDVEMHYYNNIYFIPYLALLAAEHILEFVLLNLFRMTEKGVQKEITEIEGSQKRRGIL